MSDQQQEQGGFRSLREIIGGPGITAVQFRKIALDLAEALAEHHEQYMVHGFLTPNSVVVTPEGDARILGFGVATVPVEGELPPVIDPRPDIQALGRILYELASGRPPLEGADWAAEMSRVPVEWRPTISHALEGGYPSAREMAGEIRLVTLPQLPPHHPPRKYLWVVAVIALVAIGVIAWRRSRMTASRGGRQAVAAMWVTNMTRDRSLNWLSRGIPSLLTTDLQQLPNLEVIPLSRQVDALVQHSQQLNSLQDPNIAIEVARDAGADYAVVGAVERDGPSRLRVDFQIRDTAGGRTRAKFRVTANGTNDLYQLIDTTAQRVAKELLGDAGQNPSAFRLMSLTTSNAESLKHFVMGEDAMLGFTPLPALREYEAATRLDPGFSLARFRLSEIYARAGESSQRYEQLLQAAKNPEKLPRYERMRLAVEFANMGGDSEALQKALRQVLSAFPRDTSMRNELAMSLSFSGNAQEAVRVVQEGLALDPEDIALLNQMVYASAMTGDAKASHQASDHYIELHPEDANALDTRGEMFYLLGENEDALKTFRHLLELKPDFLDFSSYWKIALILGDQGSFEDAASTLTEYEAHLSNPDRLLPMYKARLAEAMGENSAAMAGYAAAAEALGRDGRMAEAGDALMSLANVAILSGESLPAALSVVEAHKFLGEELPATAWLQAVLQDEAGADRSLRAYAATRPWLSNARKELLSNMVHVYAAMHRKDSVREVALLHGMPNQVYPWLLYARGMSGDEKSLQQSLQYGRALFMPSPLQWPSPLRQRLIRQKLGVKEPESKPGSKSGVVHL